MLGYRQTALGGLERVAVLTKVPVELGDIIEHMGIFASLFMLVYLT